MCPKPVSGPAAASVRLRATCAIQAPSAWEVEAQVFEFAAKPRVAPRRILARHREQLLDLGHPGWLDGPDARGYDSRRTLQRPARGTTQGWASPSRVAPTRSALQRARDRLGEGRCRGRSASAGGTGWASDGRYVAPARRSGAR